MTTKTELSLEESIKLLKTIVKKSEALDGANHLDFTLVSSDQRGLYQNALARANFFIKKGDISQDEFNKTLEIA